MESEFWPTRKGRRFHSSQGTVSIAQGVFPKIVTAIRHLKSSTLLLDGEVVVFDRKNVSHFQLLQQGSGPCFRL